MPTIPFPRETIMHVVKTMPAAPQILSRLGQMRLDPNVDLDDVTALLKCDAGLTTRIMRVANSPTYCIGKPYSSMEQALARVGFGEIYRIAGFAAIVQMTSQNLRLYGVSGAELRENSLITALIIEYLAQSAGLDSQEAYSAGLLRSTGKIALEGLTYSAGLLRSEDKSLHDVASRGGSRRATFDPKSEERLAEWETKLTGICNCEAAAFILNEWHFPVGIVSAIGYHYSPEQASSGPALATLLNLAAGAADRLGFGLPGERAYWELTPEKWSTAGISAGQLEEASDKGLERFCALHSAVS
jgi:HD-like signal output (HDOD) protein